MKKVLYLHGFASAGSTGTATTMRNLLYGRDVMVQSPDIPVSPLQAQQMLSDLVQAEQHGCYVCRAAKGHSPYLGESLLPHGSSADVPWLGKA